VPGIPGAGTEVARAGAGTAAAKTRVTDNTNKDKINAVRDMPVLGLDCIH
jgi:hypothetical protein